MSPRTLLHIDSSILGDHSVSRTVTAAVVAKLRAAEPSLNVIYRDLASAPLPHATPSSMPADHPISGGKGDAASQQALDEFLAADIVVIGAPMYNFTVPTQLRAWIDRIVVPGKTFAYGENGAEGLAGDKRVIVALSRGGIYADPAFAVAAEHAETYMRFILGFIGVKSPEFIVAEGISAGRREQALEGALKSAGELQAA